MKNFTLKAMLCLCVLALCSCGANRKSKSTSAGGLYPVCEITLGQTSGKQIKRLGYDLVQYDEESTVSHVYDMALWDHDGDGYPEVIYLINSDEMPEEWENRLGFSWSMPFKDWLKTLEKMGYRVEMLTRPRTQRYDDRKVFYAEIMAHYPDGKTTIQMKFNYGNNCGEGNRDTSRNTLYSIRVETVR